MRGMKTIFVVMAIAIVILATSPKVWSASLSVGGDVIHAKGTSMIQFGMHPTPKWEIYTTIISDNRGHYLWGIGGERQVIKYRRCTGHFGLVWLDKTTSLNGTHLNFSTSARCRLTKRTNLLFRHWSHGTAIGIENNRANKGFNLLGIEWRF